MRQLQCIVGAVLLVMMGFGASAMGCSCIRPGPPCQNYGGATAVFVGTPITEKTAERKPGNKPEDIDCAPRTFSFSVEQAFLGVSTAEVEIGTGRGGGDCGYDFKLGSRYLVYASQSSQSNRLTTSICTRTAPFDNATEDLEFLRGLKSLNPGVTINGEVKRNRINVAKGDAALVGPLAGIGLTVEGEGERREIKTDDQGRYSLTGLRAGKFKVTLQLPDELSTYKAEQEISVSDRGCAVVNYFVVDNGRLSGKVSGPEGQPAVGIQLQLMEADNADPLKGWGKSAQADAQGAYSFSALPPGRYLLAVNLSRYPDPNDPTNAFPRTYYPGVLDIAKAETITLGAGENVQGFDLQLPVRRAPSILTGKVVWADGTPVANAAISFREVTYHDPQTNYGIQADESGYFTVKGYVGQILVVEARSNRPYSPGVTRQFEPMEKVEPVRIVLSKPTEMVNIVITRLR